MIDLWLRRRAGDRVSMTVPVGMSVLATGPIIVTSLLFPDPGVFPFRGAAFAGVLASCVGLVIVLPPSARVLPTLGGDHRDRIGATVPRRQSARREHDPDGGVLRAAGARRRDVEAATASRRGRRHSARAVAGAARGGQRRQDRRPGVERELLRPGGRARRRRRRTGREGRGAVHRRPLGGRVHRVRDADRRADGNGRSTSIATKFSTTTN